MLLRILLAILVIMVVLALAAYGSVKSYRQKAEAARLMVEKLGSRKGTPKAPQSHTQEKR